MYVRSTKWLSPIRCGVSTYWYLYMMLCNGSCGTGHNLLILSTGPVHGHSVAKPRYLSRCEHICMCILKDVNVLAYTIHGADKGLYRCLPLLRGSTSSKGL